MDDTGTEPRTGPTTEAGIARPVSTSQVRALLAASHPRQCLALGIGVGLAALAVDRPAGQAAIAGAAVLVVQAALGLHNDVVDAERDRLSAVAGKPIARDVLPSSNASFVALCLVVLSVPLALQNGSIAGAALLLTLPVGWLSNRLLRRTPLSFLPWAATFALLAAFVSYGGSGWGRHGAAPTWQLTLAAALLGIGVHLLTALPDLVADNRTGVRHLPLRIALRTGAPRLLTLSVVYTGTVVVAGLVAAFHVGLRRG